MKSNNTLDNLEELGIGSSFTNELCDMLATTTLFREFSHEDLEKLSHYVHAYRAPKGTKILVEGEQDDYLCILIKGKVNVFKKDGKSREKQLATILEGATLGEISFVDGFPHSASAVTAGKADIVILTKHNLDKLSEKFPKLATQILWRIAWQLCVRVRQTTGILVDHIN